MTLETLQASLPIIPVYQGEEKKDRKSKIFDYPCLEVREPMMLKTYKRANESVGSDSSC